MLVRGGAGAFEGRGSCWLGEGLVLLREGSLAFKGGELVIVLLREGSRAFKG